MKETTTEESKEFKPVFIKGAGKVQRRRKGV
jgi:hypothetical protein